MSPNKSIVFAHGIWADGSCFSKLIPTLWAEGYEVITSEHGLDSHRGDVDCVLRTIGRTSNPVVLVGHSYGGALITAAGTDDRVAGLVYIAAVAPDEEETTQGQLNQFPATEVFGEVEVAEGRNWLLPGGVKWFAGDLSEEEQRIVWATAMSPVHDLFDQKCPGCGLEEQAKLVRRGSERPYRSSRTSAVRLEAHGRNGLRGGQQSRCDVVQA